MDDASPPRLNPFALPAETTARFILLNVTAIALCWAIARTFFAITLPKYLPASVSDSVMQLSEGLINLTQFNDQFYLLSADPTFYIKSGLDMIIPFVLLLLAVLGATILMFLGTVAVYNLLPSILSRHKKLQILKPEDKLYNSVITLAKQVNVPPPQTILLENRSITDGYLFGARNRYYLTLTRAVRLQQLFKPRNFRSTILHELAHISNKDANYYYFAQAIWYVLIGFVLLPWLLYPFLVWGWSLATGSGSSQIAADNFMVGLRWVGGFGLQFGLVIVVILLISRQLLRIREYYADWQAMIWGGRPGLTQLLQQKQSENRPSSWWKQLWRFHPEPHARLATLQNAEQLFRVRDDLPFFTGFLLAYLLVGSIGLWVYLIFIFRAGGEIILLWLQTRLYMTGALYGIINIVGLFRFVWRFFYLIVAFALLLAIVYFIVRCIGLQMQRESILHIIAKTPRKERYKRFLKLSLLMSAGLEFGFILIPNGIFAPRNLGSWLLIPVWLLLFTLLSWMWLVYCDFASKRFLGYLTGATFPLKTHRRLLIAKAVMLLAIYIPALIIQLAPQIANLDLSEADLTASVAFIVATAVGGFLIMLVIYALMFSLTWFLFQLKRSHVKSTCPQCDHAVPDGFVLDKQCQKCGLMLASWLYV